MATHSSILAWKIPWTEEPGWLQVVYGLCAHGIYIYTHTRRQAHMYTCISVHMPLDMSRHVCEYTRASGRGMCAPV